jgi:hypothetical protein
MTNNARQADPAPDQLTQLLHAGDVASWTLAAVAVALSGTDRAKHAAAVAVLQAARVDPTALDESGRERRAAQAVAPLLQAGAVAGAREVAWADQSDQALLAQGRASAQGGPAFAGMVPTLPGLAKLLAEPGAAILDVGTEPAHLLSRMPKRCPAYGLSASTSCLVPSRSPPVPSPAAVSPTMSRSVCKTSRTSGTPNGTQWPGCPLPSSQRRRSATASAKSQSPSSQADGSRWATAASPALRSNRPLPDSRSSVTAAPPSTTSRPTNSSTLPDSSTSPAHRCQKTPPRSLSADAHPDSQRLGSGGDRVRIRNVRARGPHSHRVSQRDRRRGLPSRRIWSLAPALRSAAARRPRTTLPDAQ